MNESIICVGAIAVMEAFCEKYLLSNCVKLLSKHHTHAAHTHTVILALFLYFLCTTYNNFIYKQTKYTRHRNKTTAIKSNGLIIT